MFNLSRGYQFASFFAVSFFLLFILLPIMPLLDFIKRLYRGNYKKIKDKVKRKWKAI